MREAKAGSFDDEQAGFCQQMAENGGTWGLPEFLRKLLYHPGPRFFQQLGVL